MHTWLLFSFFSRLLDRLLFRAEVPRVDTAPFPISLGIILLYAYPHDGVINLRVWLGSLLPAAQPSVDEDFGRADASGWIRVQGFGSERGGRKTAEIQMARRVKPSRRANDLTCIY